MPHIHEKIDFTVEVFIVHKNKVLLRMHDKYNIWLSVGGHVELDEDPNQAAIREVKEEVGLDIELVGNRNEMLDNKEYKELVPPRFLNIHSVSPTHRHITLYYFATTDSDQVTPEKQGDKWRWVTKDGLQEMDLQPNVRFHAKKALEELGG